MPFCCLSGGRQQGRVFEQDVSAEGHEVGDHPVGEVSERQRGTGWRRVWVVCRWALGRQDCEAEKDSHVDALSVWRRQVELSGTSHPKLLERAGAKGFSLEWEREVGWSWGKERASEESF